MSMLEFLVTSTARRRLLLLLWAERESGSASELASLANVAYARAYEELKAMKRLGLVATERRQAYRARKEVYRANLEHPLANLITQLVTAGSSPVETQEDVEVRRQLKWLGAPLHVEPEQPESRERAIVKGAALSHRDPTVARVLPLCLWSARDHLDWDVLIKLARQDDKRAVGFFLDLTSQLTNDPRFAVVAKLLRGKRKYALRDFFETRDSRRSSGSTFDVAERWGFQMRMTQDAFAATFNKFAHAE